MDDRHLTLALLRSVHQGRRSSGDLATLALSHLFQLCPDCREVFEDWRSERRREREEGSARNERRPETRPAATRRDRLHEERPRAARRGVSPAEGF